MRCHFPVDAFFNATYAFHKFCCFPLEIVENVFAIHQTPAARPFHKNAARHKDGGIEKYPADLSYHPCQFHQMRNTGDALALLGGRGRKQGTSGHKQNLTQVFLLQAR